MRPPAGTVPRAEGPEERSLGAPLSRRQAVCIPGSSLSAWRGCPFSRVSGSSLDVLHSEPAPLVAGAHWPLPGPPIGFSPGSVGAPASPVLTAVLLPLTPPAPLCGAFPWHILKGGDRRVSDRWCQFPAPGGLSQQTPQPAARVPVHVPASWLTHAAVPTLRNFYYEDGNKNFPGFLVFE